MNKSIFITWTVIIMSVAIAVTANTYSTKWASKGFGFGPEFWITIALSPLVFLTFGYVGAKFGLAGASAVVDSMLTIATVVVGLTAMKGLKELPWQMTTATIVCVVCIVVINVYAKK